MNILSNANLLYYQLPTKILSTRERFRIKPDSKSGSTADNQKDLFCERSWYGRMWTVPLNSVPDRKRVNYGSTPTRVSRDSLGAQSEMRLVGVVCSPISKLPSEFCSSDAFMGPHWLLTLETIMIWFLLQIPPHEAMFQTFISLFLRCFFLGTETCHRIQLWPMLP